MNNPRAFPGVEKNDDGTHHASHLGMTLRDWLAGQAISGLAGNGRFAHLPARALANIAYEQADAMLAKRSEAA